MPAPRQLPHPDLEAHIDAYLAARGSSWRQLERGEFYVGDVPVTLPELCVFLIEADPVLWAECNFIDRDTGEPWRLFDYQKVGARFLGDGIWECGAETGKTRDIVIKGTWLWLGKGPRPRGDGLIAGSLDGNLEDIYDEMIFQLENNELLYSLVDWEKSKVKPYKKLVAKNGNRIYFRPGGNDGRAFRGVHVGLFGFFDEAAKAHEKKILTEFWRALKPSAIAGLYSVPDGVTESEFFRFCRKARAVDPLGADLERLPPGVALADHAGATDAMARRDRQFVKFRWPKTLMPFPFWSPERKAGYVEQYGGIDSSDYQQNVLGNWGDPARTVFPWDRLAPCLRFNPDYRELTLTWNAGEGAIAAAAARLDPGYEVNARPGDIVEDDETGGSGTSAQPLLALFDDELPIAEFGDAAVARLVARVFGPLAGAHVAGIDCGSNEDPTVIHVYRLEGYSIPSGEGSVARQRKRLVGRLVLRRFGYPQQVKVLHHFDTLASPSWGWGLDATGVGTALEHYLLEGEGGWSLAGRLTGFIANANMPDRHPDTGEEIADEQSGKVRQVATKEFGTRLIELDVQRLDLELVPSPEITGQFPQYKARKTSSGARAFDNTHDHEIDACRVALLRAHELEHGAAPVVPIEFSVPAGMTRPSLQID